MPSPEPFQHTMKSYRANQGLRMKDSGENLLHVTVVPGGHFAAPLQIGL
jgi:hypothetical protein